MYLNRCVKHVKVNRWIHSIIVVKRCSVFFKNGALKNLAKFTGKHLCQSLFFQSGTYDIFKKLLTYSYAIILGQKTLFSTNKTIFWKKRQFYLIYHIAIFKNHFVEKYVKVLLHYNFLTIVLIKGKSIFNINGFINCFIILCIFSNFSFWRQSIFFASFFWNQKKLGFKKI